MPEVLIGGGENPEVADAEIIRAMPVATDNGLRELGSDRFDVVRTNPPFGRTSSILVVAGDGDTAREPITYKREDFWATTTNTGVRPLRKLGKARDISPPKIYWQRIRNRGRCRGKQTARNP